MQKFAYELNNTIWNGSKNKVPLKYQWRITDYY